jgi:hypothetical protein
MEWREHGLIWGYYPGIAWRDDKGHKNLRSEEPVSGPTSNHGISQKHSRSSITQLQYLVAVCHSKAKCRVQFWVLSTRDYTEMSTNPLGNKDTKSDRCLLTFQRNIKPRVFRTEEYAKQGTSSLGYSLPLTDGGSKFLWNVSELLPDSWQPLATQIWWICTSLFHTIMNTVSK